MFGGGAHRDHVGRARRVRGGGVGLVAGGRHDDDPVAVGVAQREISSGMSEAVMPPGNSSDRLMTRAPWLTAKRTPRAIVAASPLPSPLSTRTGMMRTP